MYVSSLFLLLLLFSLERGERQGLAEFFRSKLDPVNGVRWLYRHNYGIIAKMIKWASINLCTGGSLHLEPILDGVRPLRERERVRACM